MGSDLGMPRRLIFSMAALVCSIYSNRLLSVLTPLQSGLHGVGELKHFR